MRQDHREVVPRSPVLVLEYVDQIHKRCCDQQSHQAQHRRCEPLHPVWMQHVRVTSADECTASEDEQRNTTIDYRHNSYLLSLE